jgi:hypothetical protein
MQPLRLVNNWYAYSLSVIAKTWKMIGARKRGAAMPPYKSDRFLLCTPGVGQVSRSTNCRQTVSATQRLYSNVQDE